VIAKDVRGTLGVTTLEFTEQSARFIRKTHTGTNSKFNWSLYELDVCLEN